MGGILGIGTDMALVALSAGALTVAVPPTNVWPLGLIGLAPLYLAVRRQTPTDAALLGWVHGLLLHMAGFSWAPGLLQRFGHVSPACAWGIALGLCAYQATVFAVWAGASCALERYARVPWLLSAPLVMALAESAIPFLFPGNLAIVVSHAWPLLQIAEVGGPPAVSALVVLVNLALAELAQAAWRRQLPGRLVRRAAWTAIAVVAVGLVRAGGVALAQRGARHVRVGVLQPNAGIVDESDRKRHGEDYLTVLQKGTADLGRRGADLVVWPESAFPFLFDRRLTHEYASGHPWELRPGFRGALLFGSLTHAFGDSRMYNSAVLTRRDGWIAGIYDKNRLVPFGEFIPMADRFPDWAQRIRERVKDVPPIAAGDGPRVLQDGDLRIGALICYEDTFPEQVLDVAVTANLLVTVANHAWFRDSAAAPEALALATLRSVETRRALVRATDTGVSSFGDALGRIVKTGPLIDVARYQPPSPVLLVEDVPLLDIFALGPRSIPLFPYACAMSLAISIIAFRLGGSRPRDVSASRGGA
jgi:apolipoprotein N-acyltransferase